MGSAVEAASLSAQYAPLSLLGGGYTDALTHGQVQALAYMPIDLLEAGYGTYTAFFSFYGLALGYLVFRSTFMPRVIGVLLAFGALCYLTYSFTSLLFPGFAHHLVPYIQLPSLVGEGSFCLWLLIAGVNAERWKQLESTTTSRLEWAQ
jgi:hypothetical protein